MIETQQKAISASQAKLHFGEMLNKCIFGNKPIYIKRHDKTVAVLISFDDWKNLKKIPVKNEQKKSPLYYKILKLHHDIADYRKKNKIKVTKTTEEIIKEDREERTKKLLKPL